ncbi:MAG: hypothetical protein N3D11_11930 [Candidatus Sumerlaeia bacterium]|nr:hypothetical protein [Candidatus Sumerlaeia bacterium]
MRETKYWTWHLAAGVLVLFLLGLHMAIMHLDSLLGVWVLNPSGGEAIAWANVLARSRMVAMIVVYIALLGAALYHGFYGLRTIVFELAIGPALQRVVTVGLWAAGLGLFVLGTVAAIAAGRL